MISLFFGIRTSEIPSPKHYMMKDNQVYCTQMHCISDYPMTDVDTTCTSQVVPNTITVDSIFCDMASVMSGSVAAANQHRFGEVESQFSNRNRNVPCNPDVTSATLELLMKLYSWLIYSLCPNDTSYQTSCHATHLRQGIFAVFHPFMPPFLRMTEIPNHEKDAKTDAYFLDDVSESDTVSEYSDYDNVRLNPRCHNISPGDNLSEESLTSIPISSQAQIQLVDVASVSFFHSTGEQHDDPFDSRPTVSSLIITQVDVANMTKKASHNYDVRSILKFPVVTFHKSPTPPPREVIEYDSNGWSWIAVSKDLDVADTLEEPMKAEDVSKNACIICHERLDEGDQVRILPCSHCFHVGCSDILLSRTLSRKKSLCSFGCSTCQTSLMVNNHGTIERIDTSSSDGSVPAWAFTRIGRAL